MKVINKNHEMSEEDADKLFGKRLTQNTKWVMRFKRTTDDNLIVRFHAIQNGKEILPLGYVLGNNIIVKRDN